MAIRITRKKIIITVVVILVLAGAGAAYAYITGYFTPSTKDSGTTTVPKTGTAYKAGLQQKQEKVDTLIAAGGDKSIEQAEQILDTEVKTAAESGNEDYSFDALLAKAGLLIQTGRSQEALDTVLFPLDKKYGTNETYRYEIYASISWAYRGLDDQAKANEYFNKIPPKGWN